MSGFIVFTIIALFTLIITVSIIIFSKEDSSIRSYCEMYSLCTLILLFILNLICGRPIQSYHIKYIETTENGVTNIDSVLVIDNIEFYFMKR